MEPDKCSQEETEPVPSFMIMHVTSCPQVTDGEMLLLFFLHFILIAFWLKANITANNVATGQHFLKWD